jgi:hypothetical protein
MINSGVSLDNVNVNVGEADTLCLTNWPAGCSTRPGFPHVRFDERGWETGLCYRAHPRLYQTTMSRCHDHRHAVALQAVAA